MSTSIPLTPEQKAQKWGTVAKWGAFAVGGFLFAPFAMATIGGMVGLVVVAGICATTWAITPAIETRAKNLRLSMLKSAAMADPVGTLQNEYRRRQQELHDREQAIESFSAQTKTFESKIVEIGRKFPADVPALKAKHAKLIQVLEQRRDKWIQARAQLERFATEIERASMLWDAAKAAAAAEESSGLSEADFHAQLKTQTSLDAVTNALNESFASLETSLMRDEADDLVTKQAALPAASGTTIEIDVTPVKTRARA